jgi:hypothetical protein
VKYVTDKRVAGADNGTTINEYLEGNEAHREPAGDPGSPQK